MFSPRSPAPQSLATLSLLVAATCWGLVWYPYRLLEEAGLGGSLATILTYLVATALVLARYGFGALRVRGDHGWLLAVALTSGWTNLAYVLAVIDGEIMRVMLLFYLAPLWTVLFARLILGERTDRHGYRIILLSLLGAWVMLYRPEGGLPLPSGAAEWLGLSAGCGFAASNVLSRRLRHVPEISRSLWIFIGVIGVAIGVLLIEGPRAATLPLAMEGGSLALVLFTGAWLVLATLSVQYGLAHTGANRAIVILLAELVVAALASWALAGEQMSWQEWVGGTMIVAATLLSGKMEKPDA